MKRGLEQLRIGFWLLVLAAILVVQVVAALRQHRPNDFLALLPTLALIYKHAVANYDLLTFWTERAKLWLTNASTEWSLDVRLDLDDVELDPATASIDLERTLRDAHKADFQMTRRSPSEFNFRLRRLLSATTVVESGEEGPFISIRILDMNVSYRDATRRIEKHICPMFELVEQHFHIRPDGRKYGLIAYFPDGNPYFGVFIHKLKVATIDTFSLTIKTDRRDSTLAVKRDSVELVTRSLDRFRTELVKTFRLEIGAN